MSNLINPHYNDVYARGGLPEKHYTFLELQSLPSRLSSSESFTIAELGTGLGLTLLALHALLESLPRKPRVTVHSYELHPQNLAGLPGPLPQVSGTYHWPHFTLHLHIGDATHTLPQTEPFLADAWFLDGHDPAKNPALWAPELLQEVARRTVPGGTASTYSVARSVRDALTAAGFLLQKKQGFPPKREALLAQKI